MIHSVKIAVSILVFSFIFFNTSNAQEKTDWSYELGVGVDVYGPWDKIAEEALHRYPGGIVSLDMRQAVSERKTSGFVFSVQDGLSHYNNINHHRYDRYGLQISAMRTHEWYFGDVDAKLTPFVGIGYGMGFGFLNTYSGQQVSDPFYALLAARTGVGIGKRLSFTVELRKATNVKDIILNPYSSCSFRVGYSL